MAARLILTYPDARLRRDSLPVKFDDPKEVEELENLVNDIRHTMIVHGGLGLAAPQVNILKRMFVVDVNGLKNYKQFDQEPIKGTLTFINPIVSRIDEPTRASEACLSVPGVVYSVERYRVIDLSYQDVTGKLHYCRIVGEDAVVIQHEAQHLEGKLFIDMISSIDKAHFKKSQLKLKPKKEMTEGQVSALRVANRAKARAKRKKKT